MVVNSNCKILSIDMVINYDGMILCMNIKYEIKYEIKYII